MGVFPEPALCADDVSRFVSIDTVGSNDAALRMRSSQATRGSQAARRAGLITAFALSVAFGAAVPATASENTTAAVTIDAKLRLSDAPPQWGGEALLDQEPLKSAIVESTSAETAKPAASSLSTTVTFGDKSLPRWLVEAITQAAGETGIEPAYLMALADKESSFDIDAKNPASSALGLFQFVRGTWLELIRDCGAKYGLAEEAAAIGRGTRVADGKTRDRILAMRKDAYVSGLMAGELIRRDRARIEDRIGRELKTTELYLAHFLGTHSAGKFLSLSAEAPRKVASSAFRRAARANRTLFVDGKRGKGRALTVAEVHERLDDMIDRRITKFEDVVKVAAPMPEPLADKVETPILDARLRLRDEAIPEVK